MPGVPKTIEKLNQEKIDLAIVTKGNERYQKSKIEQSKIDKSKFKIILTVNYYNKSRPYVRISRQLNHTPNETLVVGDKYPTDLIPAKTLK